ncbi:DUF488 family protein [Novipirellula caenicola]|uniref:DUF488 domain-containing protein n=1 Tax=Novipirellula caenicola TaxID=1536901 RepID=A0ABP9VY72_9BACT
MRTILTIGYEGLEIREFVERLTAADVDMLVDVRELPASRKRGFSKSALTQNLENAGIEYTHFRSLGSPKALRHAVRKNRDYATFFSGVRKHLKSEDAREALSEIRNMSKRYRLCLLCFCGDWRKCHRSEVIHALTTSATLSIEHLPNQWPQTSAA